MYSTGVETLVKNKEKIMMKKMQSGDG